MHCLRSARKSYVQMLDPIQNQALRLCLGAFRTTPVESLQVEANEPPLVLRRNKLALQYALKVQSNPSNPAFDCIYNPHYRQTFEKKETAIPTIGIRVEHLLLDANIDVDVIAPYTLPTIPPWTIQSPTINLSLHSGNKARMDPNIYKAQFGEILDEHPDHICLYTDGSKESDSVASAAVSGQSVMQCCLPGCSSVFTAELQAISLALDFIENSSHNEFLIFSDSLSSLQAIQSKQFDVPLIRNILERHHYLQNTNKTVSLWWIPSHVGIRGNERADSAAKAALALPESDVRIPHTDLKQKTNSYFLDKWQTSWNNTNFNKLQLIKPHLGETILKGIVKRR